jgi:hypothetical protein
MHSLKDKLIVEFNVVKVMEITFGKILENNTVEELDIENKSVSINIQNIEYDKTKSNFHRFQVPILNDYNVQIGFFALIISNENEIIDELFVIE